MVIGIYGKLCEVETGQNNIIVDIEESRGNGKFKNIAYMLPLPIEVNFAIYFTI